MFGIGSQGSPAWGSPARGSKRSAMPSSSDGGSSSPRKSPRLSSPARGVRGRGASRGTSRSVPVGRVDPQPRGQGVLPGKSGFVQQGASRSSLRLILPSFSTEEEDDEEEDDDKNNDDDDDDDDDEVDFPNQGNAQRRRQMANAGKQPRQPIAAKNLIHAPRCGQSRFAEIAAWNRTARQGVWNETKRGWMAKTEQ